MVASLHNILSSGVDLFSESKYVLVLHFTSLFLFHAVVEPQTPNHARGGYVVSRNAIENSSRK